MHFFLHQIVARLVFLYLLNDCCREIRNALAHDEIRQFNPNIVNWTRRIVKKSAEPIWFRVQVGQQGFIAAACLYLVVFGWPPPSG